MCSRLMPRHGDLAKRHRALMSVRVESHENRRESASLQPIFARIDISLMADCIRRVRGSNAACARTYIDRAASAHEQI